MVLYLFTLKGATKLFYYHLTPRHVNGFVSNFEVSKFEVSNFEVSNFEVSKFDASKERKMFTKSKK
jgi:hypothetical protein